MSNHTYPRRLAATIAMAALATVAGIAGGEAAGAQASRSDLDNAHGAPSCSLHPTRSTDGTIDLTNRNGQPRHLQIWSADPFAFLVNQQLDIDGTVTVPDDAALQIRWAGSRYSLGDYANLSPAWCGSDTEPEPPLDVECPEGTITTLTFRADGDAPVLSGHLEEDGRLVQFATAVQPEPGVWRLITGYSAELSPRHVALVDITSGHDITSMEATCLPDTPTDPPPSTSVAPDPVEPPPTVTGPEATTTTLCTEDCGEAGVADVDICVTTPDHGVCGIHVTRTELAATGAGSGPLVAVAGTLIATGLTCLAFLPARRRLAARNRTEVQS